jgi:hypothetical protein
MYRSGDIGRWVKMVACAMFNEVMSGPGVGGEGMDVLVMSG